MRGTELLIGAIVGAVFALFTYYSRQRRLTYENQTTDNGSSSQNYSRPPSQTEHTGRRESLSQCAICLQVVHPNSEDTRKLRCGHIFHRSCLVTWFQHKRQCPLCRKPASQ